MTILDKYNDINDLKKLDCKQLKLLSNEIREFLINLSKQKEIHLSSNLGIIELTISLLLEFDLNNDVLIYDTGHQTYVHKMLTDRLKKIKTIRNDNGISGLLDMYESKYDHYSPGHSGNAISVLDGMYQKIKDNNKDKVKRQYFNQNYHVVVVGDAAINCGLSFEGLNDIGSSNDPLIIIINDNGMSISESVGIFSKALRQIKNTSSFFELEKFTRKIFNFSKTYYFIYRFYKQLEQCIFKKNIFENLNFEYVGPIDGHDIKKIRKSLQKAKWYSHQGPVIVHIKTNKGKGYSIAEQDKIGNYHSNSLKNNCTFGSIAYENLNKKIHMNKDLWILNPAMNIGSGFGNMLIENIKHYQDTGINEEHTISKASGMLLKGLKVYCVFYSTFLQRSYDQLLHDVSRLNLGLIILLDRSDLNGGDGPSHHGIFDVGYLKSIPNTEIISPRNFDQLNQLIDYTYNHNFDHIVVIRYPKSLFVNKEINSNYQIINYEWEKLISNNSQRVIITYGPYTDVIYEELISQKIDCDLVCATWITKYDIKVLEQIFNKYPTIIIYERIYGKLGIYNDLVSYKSEKNLNNKIISYSYKNFVGSGTTKSMDKKVHMDVENLISDLKEN